VDHVSEGLANAQSKHHYRPTVGDSLHYSGLWAAHYPEAFLAQFGPQLHCLVERVEEQGCVVKGAYQHTDHRNNYQGDQ